VKTGPSLAGGPPPTVRKTSLPGQNSTIHPEIVQNCPVCCGVHFFETASARLLGLDKALKWNSLSPAPMVLQIDE
jgi:hypothetical protein